MVTINVMTKKVLICDDSSFARKQLTRALPPEWPVELFYAKDGHEGLSLIEKHKIDLVFLDLTMPNLDGYGVLEALNKSNIKTTIIITSADIQPGAHDRVNKLGVAGFIKKPFDNDCVKAMLIKTGILTGG